MRRKKEGRGGPERGYSQRRIRNLYSVKFAHVSVLVGFFSFFTFLLINIILCSTELRPGKLWWLAVELVVVMSAAAPASEKERLGCEMGEPDSHSING